MKPIRIATRKSPLALWQANFVKDRLMQAHPGLGVEIVGMTTQGDEKLDRSLSKVGGKGLFLKELEVSLLNNETDIAVHSMKDVPYSLPKGLEIAVVCERENAQDAFVSNEYQNLYALPNGARVGTSSLRRTAQLKYAFPKLEFVALRGNVNSRLKKLDTGDYDAIILAAAGLIRLGFTDRIKQYISPDLCLPAVGQGIVGIECRSDDERTRQLLEPLHNRESALYLAAERAMNARLEGGCQVPVAGFAEVVKGKVRLRGLVGEADGSGCISSEMFESQMNIKSAQKLGERVAQELLDQGAGRILTALAADPVELKPLEKPVVILTRQKEFLGNTQSILQTLDFEPVHVPALKIDPKYDAEVLQKFANISDYTDIVFVSRNSVEMGMPMIEQQSGVPNTVRVLAMGAETAKQLYQYGIDALFPDGGTGAEALLKVSKLADLSARRVLIVRGDLGLDWPAREMTKRGAVVENAICYLHSKPDDLESRFQHAVRDNPRLSGIFVHSAQSAVNLMNEVKKYRDETRGVKLIVGSENISQVALEQGWTNEIVVAESPSNKHMMIAFANCNKSRH